MKKIVILTSLILFLAGCSTNTEPKTPTPTPTLTPTPIVTPDATSAATQYDGETGATVDVNGSEYSVSLAFDDIEKIILDKEPNAKITKYELDDDHGRIVYDIEINSGKSEYDITIDANTGEIVVWELDK
ncbi:PepSY domain-containing protein [Anaerorhabdus sp.]|uniref:PepSY domain-containing protein n=1 Tax=Anaerorhabdus sp. TaxID=1872524 RepID=UPI002FC6AE4D